MNGLWEKHYLFHAKYLFPLEHKPFSNKTDRPFSRKHDKNLSYYFYQLLEQLFHLVQW